MNPWLMLLAGLVIGFCLGLLVMGMLVVARRWEPKVIGRDEISQLKG